MTKKFAVLGGGSWGTALALVLAKNGYPVKLWSKEADHCADMAKNRCNARYLPEHLFPELLSIEADLISAVTGSDEILIAVPSHGFVEVLEKIQAHLHQDGILWATKGLDPKSGEFLSVAAERILGPSIHKALLTGPSFAKEVANEMPTMVTIAGQSLAFNQRVQSAFQSDYFRAYLSDDLMGAQLGGAVKNILAIAVGIAEGLGYGTNTRAGIMTRGLAEMIRLGQALGAKQETLIGLSGLGDLILTCSDNQSRNRRFGLNLGQGQGIDAACASIGQVVEGIQTTHSVFNLAQKFQVEMPITGQMELLLAGKTSPLEAVRSLTNRSAGKKE